MLILMKNTLLSSIKNRINHPFFFILKYNILVYIAIATITVIGIAISVIFFLNFTPTEKLELCAGIYDDMIKNKNSEELRWQYDANNCSDSILQWAPLAESEVTIPE